MHDEHARQQGLNNRKYNEYEFFDDYVVGYTRAHKYPFIIDKDDYELVSQYCWHKHQDGYLRTMYECGKGEDGKQHNKYILLHNLLFGRFNAEDGDVDHIDGDPANNRRSNLRLITHSQNGMNHKLPSNNKTGCSGVYYNSRMGKYHAGINVDKKPKHLGWFDTLEEAIVARKEAEKEYYGEYARSE